MTQPAAPSEVAFADNVRLRTELQELRDQNFQLRRQLAVATQQAYSVPLTLIPTIPSPETVNGVGSAQSTPPSNWQPRRFNNDTYYIVPLYARTAVAVPK